MMIMPALVVVWMDIGHVLPVHLNFVDFYQASIKGRGKRIETHFAKNAYEEANIKVNNALIEEIPIAPIDDIFFAPMDAKSLDVLDFFNDPIDMAKTFGWWQNTHTSSV